MPFVKINGHLFTFFTDFPEKIHFSHFKLFNAIFPAYLLINIISFSFFTHLISYMVSSFPPFPFLSTHTISVTKGGKLCDIFSRKQSKDLTNAFNCDIL